MKNEKKTTIFSLLLFYIGKTIFCQKTYFEKLSLYCYIWQVIGNVITPTSIQIFFGFVDVIHRSKILGNRLGILKQIFTVTSYFFFICLFQKSTFYLGKECILIWAINFIIKSIRKGNEILAKHLFSFSIIVFNLKLLVKLFIRKEKHLLEKIFGSPHISNRIYLLQNYFSNYVYFKDMYISLKGIGKIMVVMVLIVLLICNFLSLTIAFTKKN